MSTGGIDSQFDAEAVNDSLAVEHPIDDYYARSALPIRLVERRRLAAIRDFMGDVAGLEVAEIGVGGGHVLRMFPAARLTAVDISRIQLDVAKKNLAGYDVRFIHGDASKIELPAASFDRVICSEVLEHVVDPDSVLAAIARLLQPAGIAVLTIPNDPIILRLKGAIRRTPARRLFGDRIEWGGDDYHLHRWSPSDFERLVQPHLRVVGRRMVPMAMVPLRACFKCVPRAETDSAGVSTTITA